MTIGKLAQASGVNAKLIRHYEAIGLIPKPHRTDSGYRMYATTDVQFLRFIKRARLLGFSIKDIKKLLGLWRNKTRASQEVKRLALTHIDELESKIHQMQDMVKSLRDLAHKCHGNQRPDCPIIKALASEKHD